MVSGSKGSEGSPILLDREMLDRCLGTSAKEIQVNPGRKKDGMGGLGGIMPGD